MTTEEILTLSTAKDAITELKRKSISVRPWAGKDGLAAEYDSNQHPVMSKSEYPDVQGEKGTIEKVTRIPLNFQKLAVSRMTELVCGIPVKRIYRPKDDRQKQVAEWIENIFERVRIDTMNTERLTMLFGSCEVMTLWYAVEQRTGIYGFDSSLKLRCRNFSPMNGDELFPLFDEYGDMIAMSVGYTRKVKEQNVTFFDTYTADRHIKWSNEGGEMSVVEDEHITLGKIPAAYCYRPTPIWENASKLVEEMEWSLSRNGNYLRKNSKPLFVVYADQQIDYGNEKDEKEEYRTILQFPRGSQAGYVTWSQAIENLKFHVGELRSLFFTQLQLPDWSYEKMSQQALSGESRKQLFIDSQLKVRDESGRLLEFFDREVNIVKAFLKGMVQGYDEAIDALAVETVITPFSITDDKDTISTLMTATGGKAIMSQREGIETLGWSKDPDATLAQIAAEDTANVFEGYE